MHFLAMTRRMCSTKESSDRRRASGQLLGSLDGVPVCLKDVISAKGQPHAASKILENYRSPYDATVIKLKEAGAVVGGRLNLDEFAMGSSTALLMAPPETWD